MILRLQLFFFDSSMFVPCASANHGETKQTSSANWQTDTEIDTKAVSIFCTVSSRDGLTSCCYIVAFPSFPCTWVGIILRWQGFLVFVVVSTDSVYTYNVTYSYSTHCVYVCTPGQLTERQNQNSCRGIPILQYLNFNSRQL